MVSEYVSTDEELENEKLEKKKMLYSDKKKIMLAILKIIKYLNIPLEKLIWEKSVEEINEEIYKTKIKIDFDELTKESMKNMYNAEVKKKIIRRKYDSIPPLLDFMFNLFITHYMPEYPAYGLPNLNAFYFACGVIKAKGLDTSLNFFNKTGKLFELFLKDDLYKDVCVEEPPYYILNFSEDVMLEKNLNEIFIPKLNELFDCIIEINPFEKEKAETNGKMEVEEDDNIYMVD